MFATISTKTSTRGYTYTVFHGTKGQELSFAADLVTAMVRFSVLWPEVEVTEIVEYQQQEPYCTPMSDEEIARKAAYQPYESFL